MNTDVELKVLNRTKLSLIAKSVKDLEAITSIILANAKSLKKLTITNQITEVTPVEATKLAQAIQTCNSLETFVFANFKQLFQLGILEIISAVLSQPKLKMLSFAGTYIARKGTKAVCDLLSTNTSLEKLYLNNSAILPDFNYAHFGEMLRKNNHLKVIDLSDNPIAYANRMKAYFDIERSVKKNKRSRLSKLIFNCLPSFLENENQFNELTKKTCWDYDVPNDTNTDLKSSDWYLEQYSSNRLEHDEKYNQAKNDIQSAQHYVAERRLLRVTSLEEFQEAVTEIANNINSPEIVVYAEGSFTIPTVSLDNLINALNKCQQLKRLSIQFDNAFGKDVYRLIDGLKNLPALTELDLSFTLLGKSGFATLNTWLATNPPLRKLNITHSGLYAFESYSKLGAALAVNKNLKVLKISKNFINEPRISLLKSFLENKNMLVFFDLEKSWYDYLVLLNHFITQQPFDQEQKRWDSRDGNIRFIQQAVTSKSNPPNFYGEFTQTCFAGIDLQRSLAKKYQTPPNKWEYEKKLNAKIERGFAFFNPGSVMTSTPKVPVVKQLNEIRVTPAYDESSNLLKSTTHKF